MMTKWIRYDYKDDEGLFGIVDSDSVEEHVMQKAILTIGSLPEVSKGVVDIRLESMS